MIDNFKVEIMDNGIKYSMELTHDNFEEGLPYSLAQIFIDILDKTNANPNIVIEELVDHYGRSEESLIS